MAMASIGEVGEIQEYMFLLTYQRPFPPGGNSTGDTRSLMEVCFLSVVKLQ